ncbi:hypothetical protein ABVT39_020428 [Epinephelus coioides]
MGTTYSQEDFDRYALQLYEATFEHPCQLPDIGIDESLLKYSGTDSNAVLQAYSNELINMVPGLVEKLGSALGPVTSVPNAVGLGALVISMILEIAIKSSPQTGDNSYNMFRRVFGEEKASMVRDTMSEYLRRHRMFVNNEQRLRGEIRRLEGQMSNHLTILKNSLLYDGQMSTHGLKVWVNGASFHIQMLIHEARLNVLTGRCASDYVNAIDTNINLYVQDLDKLLEKYKTHKLSTTYTLYNMNCIHRSCVPATCSIGHGGTNCRRVNVVRRSNPCQDEGLVEAYVNLFFSRYEAIVGIKTHFLNVKNNLNYLINQHDSFFLPSRG